MYRNSTDHVKLMTVFHPFSFKDRADISCPAPSPTNFWLGCQRVSSVIIGYTTPYIESFICLFLLIRVYVHGVAAGLLQSYYPHSLLSVVIYFATFI